MKNFFRWTFRICVTLLCLTLLLAVVAVLLKDIIAKSITEKNLRDETGMDASISKLEVGLATPTIHLEGLKLYNPPEFGGGTFLDMPELRVEWLPAEIKQGKVRFKTLRVNVAEVNIIKNKNGKTNIETVHKQVSNKKPAKGGIDVPGVDFGGVETVYLKVGKIRFTDENSPRNSGEFNLGSREEIGKDLKTEKEMEQWFQIALFKMAMAQVATSSGPDRDKLQKLLFDSVLRSITGRR
jgi:uncharacterized protein involved in outer membrane biogenesis